MIYSSLDSSRQDKSNGGKIIQIGVIFVKIAIFQKFQVRSDRVNCITRPDISGRVGSGTRISGQKCGALLLTASNIGKYPKSCLASGLLRRHVGILPIDKYIGCSWLLPNVSVVVASEYKISDNNLAPVGKDPSVFFHHIPLFCSL